MIHDIKPRRTVGRPKGPDMEKTTIEFTHPEKALIREVKNITKKPSYRVVLIDAVLHHYPDAPGILAREQELHERNQVKQSARDSSAEAIQKEFN
jgi:hypothetical protein